MTKATGIAADILSLPSGGPELRPLGEKFQPDLYSGTGNFSIPLSLPPAQNGLAPELTLSYSTGGGGGAFGLGWDIWSMRVSRSTQQGVPQYGSVDGGGHDRFVLADAEELVPVAEDRYRPMTEARFWLVRRTGDHWTVSTKDGTVYHLGRTAASRVSDADGEGNRVVAWLVDQITDPNGNCIDWTYRRDGKRLYPDTVSYGPFTVAFDYEERPDPTFNCRSGFRIDTRLRCTDIRILSTRAPNNLMRRYRLQYENPEPRGVSLLARVTLGGPGGEADSALPATSFTYSPFDLATASYRRFKTPEGISPPRDLTDMETNLVDLSGDGLPDVVDSSGVSPVLWRNLGEGRWGRPKALDRFPSGATLGSPHLRFADLEGNGTADLLEADESTTGFFPNAAASGWEKMVRYRQALPFSLTDPNLRLYDIDGNGRTDAVMSGTEAFLLFRNLGRDGWESRAQVVRRKHDAALWPDLFFDDPRVFVADMNGDGLNDLVLLRSGQVAYWPYLGHGVWGERILMSGAPILPRNYAPANLFLVDVDGDGAADVIYVDSDRTLVWCNRGGAVFADPVVVAPTPPVASGTVVIADMIGVGRPGLLFSYPRDLPGAEEYRFLALGGDVAPYVMTSIDNGMGALTRIEYRSSTSYLLEDLEAGSPWTTFLPFPLNVVSAITVEDRPAGVSGRTDYRYHEGHYDGIEREFRGFGRVEELQDVDDAEPAVLRESIFDPGTDPSLSERERRALPADVRAAQRSLRGTLKQLRVFARDVPGGVFVLREELDNTWSIRTEFEGPSGVVLFPHQTEAMQVEHADNDTLPGPSRYIRTLYTGHDEFGNLTGKEQTTGRVDADGGLVEDSFRRETYDYAADPAGQNRWAVGYLARVAVADRHRVPWSVVRYHYDGEGFVGLPFGWVERGNLSRLEELVWSIEDPLPDGFEAVDPTTLGYHEAGSLETSDHGWYRDKLRQRFNPSGSVAEFMSPLGQKAIVTYDTDGVYPTKVVDAAGLTTEAVYDHAVEQVASLTNPSGYTDARAYDAVGRVTHLFRTADDGSLQLTRVIRYDIGDMEAEPLRPASITTLVCRERDRSPGEFTDPSAPLESLPSIFVQRVFYGGSGIELQRTATAEADENGAFRVVVSGVRRFSRRGRVASEAQPTFGADFTFRQLDANQQAPAHEFTYDYRGRVTSTRRPDGKMRLTQYAPFTSVAFDERDTEDVAKPSRTERFNGQGHLVAVTEHPSANHTPSTAYSYDFNGNLVGISDARGEQVLDARFDKLGRKMRVSHADAGRRRYLHDAAGNIISSVEPRGIKLRNSYDALGRLVELHRIDGDHPVLLRHYQYDEDHEHPSRPFLLGRVAQVQDESGTVQFSYNAAGQPTIVRRTLLDGRTLQSTRRYDHLGALVALVYPDNAEIEYHYNDALLLDEVPGFVSRIRYDVMAQITDISYANGVRSTFDRDPLLHRLTELETKGVDGLSILQRLAYEYGATADVTAIEDLTEATPVRQGFGYDGSHRLVSRQIGAGPTSAYAYDDAGNVIRMDDGVDGTLEYDPAPGSNRLVRYQPRGAAVPIDVQYDAAGNITHRGDLVMLSYDPFGRLVRGERDDGTIVDIDYDYRGGRVRRVVQRGVTVESTVYLDDLYEESPDGRVRYVRAPFGLLAEVHVTADDTVSVLYHHPDHLGSTTLVTTDSGTVFARTRYSPYGIAENGGAAEHHPHFTGHEFEPVLGLYIFGARFYDPVTGRFLSVDVAVVEVPTDFLYFPQGLNPYAYAGNNPLRFRDPSGRFLIVAALIGLAIGAAIGALVAAEQGGSVGDILLGALIGGTVGFFTGGFGLLGSAMLGAGTSGLFAAIKGDDKIFTAAAIGFAFGALGGMANWVPAVGGEGLWIDAANFAIEVGADAGLSGLQSGVSNAVAGKNFWEGFTSGLVTGAVIGSGKALIFGVKYDPFSKANRNDVMAQFAKDNAADRSYVAAKVQKAGFPDLKGVEFRRHGLFDLVNGGRSFVLGSNANMASGQEYSVDVLAHEIRHIAQQQALTLGSAEFYVVWTVQLFTKGNVMYVNIPANTTFEVPTVP